MKTKSVMEGTEGSAGTTNPDRDVTEKRSASISIIRGKTKIALRANNMKILKNKELKVSNVQVVALSVQGCSH